MLFRYHNLLCSRLSKPGRTFMNYPMIRTILFAGMIAGLWMAASGQPAAQASGTVSGKVVDSRTNLPVEYANVIIFTRDTAVVNGGITTGEGVFMVRGVPFGSYKLKVSFIGYDDLWIDTLILNGRNRNVLFEPIKLSQSSQMLENVTVTAQRSVLEMQIDRRVFNVDQSILTQGQTASEVLETVPTVEVDMDGNVSLRGSGNVTILIDGRPSALMGSDVATALQQIPAGMIESIEIITNPSAKFDPEGMSGIINIKLRKDRRAGLNGVATVGYGTWEKYNGSLNLNYRTQKFNLFTNYSFNNRDFFRKGTTFTVNRRNPDSLHYVDQDIHLDMLRRSHMIRGGADWFINSKNTLSAFITYNTNSRSSDETVNTEYRDSQEIPSVITRRLSDNSSLGSGHDIVLTWQKKYDTQGRELLVDANYSANNSSGDAWYEDTYTLLDYLESMAYGQDRRLNDDFSRLASLQADYTHPVTANSKIEAGGRFGYRLIDNDQDARLYDTLLGDWVPDTLRINHFIYDEYIVAGYTTWSGKVQKFSYKAGLRYEHTWTRGRLIDTGDEFTNKYPALFPSLHISYKMNSETEFQISYSRRISRPRSRALNPFANYSDPLNVRQGNPYLEPEYTNSFEVGFSRMFKKASIIASVFYRQVNNQMERYKFITPEGVTVMTYQNLSSGIQYGYELVGTYNPYRWWTMNATFNMNQRVLDASKIQEGLGNSGMMWSTRLMSTLNLKTGTSVQITGYYSSPWIMTIGVSAPRYGMDMGVRQSLLKNKASLSLRFSDVFYTSRWKMSLDGIGFSQEVERYFDSRVVNLTFSYQFGQQQRDQSSRRRGTREQNGGDDGGDMMF